MIASRANKITGEQLLNRMNKQSDFPAVLQHITEINMKTSPSSNSTANELASIILKDYSLTSKLLKVVNSAMYRQFSGQISTVSRAVVILGFEQVRLTATGLMFFAHLQDKSTAPQVKEEVLSSFLSGILAQDLSKHLNMGDWEDLFICAMFHNFGRLLVMYYFPDRYETYLKLITEEKLTDVTAMQKTIGTTFDALGMEVADLWHLPKLIISSMKIIPEQEIQYKNEQIDRHRKLANFANEICDITINCAPDQRQEQLRTVLKKYKDAYDVLEDDIIKIMDSALIKMRDFADVLNLKQTDLNKLDQRSFKAQSEPASVSTFEEQASVPNAPEHDEVSVENRQKVMLDAIQEITNAMLDDFNLDPVLTMILETVYRGIGFDQALIFFHNPKTNAMEPRFGLGQNIQELMTKFSFPVQNTSGDLFNLALAEGRDLCIEDISASDVNQRQPTWFRDIIFAPSFVLYPILINKKPIGLIYGAHNSPSHHLDQHQLDALKTLRNQAALAIKLSPASAL